MRHTLFILLLVIFSHTTMAQLILLEQPPKHYICYRTNGEISIDGKLDEKEWDLVDWTDTFVDIEGDKQPLPYHKTKVKMLWDDNYLYIAAQLEEPHLWATYTERESVIYHENNFEVFIDPNGDTHNYYEYEVNALGTEWDLMMTMPYRYNGLPINAWDIAGLKAGIDLQGTLNDPSDIDKGWTVELALPWETIKESATRGPGPFAGDQWRINFSRVQWKLDVVDGEYTKTINPETGTPYPEHNWVWSPQHVIDMHKPEYWGVLQLSGIEAGKGKENYSKNPDFETKIILRELFDLQHAYKRTHNRFAYTIDELDFQHEILINRNIIFDVVDNRFTLSCKAAEEGTSWYIREDSKIWKAASYAQ